MYQKKKQSIKPWVGAGVFLTVLIWLAFALGDTLAPFAVAAVLAYVLDPLVEWLQKKGFNRAVASMTVMVFALLLLAVLLLIIVPMLVGQFNSMVSRLPQLAGFMQNTLLPLLKDTVGNYVEIDQASVIAWLQAHTGELSNALKAWFPVLMRQSSNIVSSIGNLLLLPLLLYYFLLDWQRWSCGISKLVPRRFADTYTRITGNLNEVLGEFLRGQLLVMLIMGLVYGLGLVLVGLDSGFAIGMLAGILVFVPYLGAFTGLLLATVAALLQFASWNGILAVWAVVAVGQFLESFFITPKIVGDRIGLSPFWVIFSLMAFGQLMGFVGMLAGLPLAAVTLVLLREGVQKYFASSFYLNR